MNLRAFVRVTHALLIVLRIPCSGESDGERAHFGQSGLLRRLRPRCRKSERLIALKYHWGVQVIRAGQITRLPELCNCQNRPFDATPLASARIVSSGS